MPGVSIVRTLPDRRSGPAGHGSRHLEWHHPQGLHCRPLRGRRYKPRHLNRKLKEFGLEPPSVLIRKCRMKQAARRLHGRKVQQIVIRIQLRLAYDHRIDLQGPISESH